MAKRQLWRFANDTSAAPYPKRPPAPRPSRAVAGPAQIVHKSLALPAASLSDDEGRESEDEASERDDAAGKPAETHTRPTRVAAQSKRPTRVANDVLAVRPGPEPTAARAMVTVDSLDSARAAAAAQRQAVRPMSEEPLDLAATDDEGDTPPPLTISPVPPRGPPPRLTEDRVRMPASAQAVARAQQYERIAHAAAEDDQTFAIDRRAESLSA